MELTIQYILSQIFMIMMYGLMGLTYYEKTRNKILILNFLSLVSSGIAYIFLNAYTGLAMCFVSIVRNLIFLVDEKKNGKNKINNQKDLMILISIYVLLIICTIITYDGFLSLLSVFATSLYTFSVWQKKTNIYKLLGIPVGILWILYNIYIFSIVGIIFESILLICAVTGYKLEKNNYRSKYENRNRYR